LRRPARPDLLLTQIAEAHIRDTGVGFFDCEIAMFTPRQALSLLILAGGKSTRMGQDKVWLMLDGRPLVMRVIDRVLPLVDEVVVSTNQPDAFEARLPNMTVPARAVADRYHGAGPLAGLHAGLLAARYDLVLTLAADMPFVNPALISYLAQLAGGLAVDAVVPQVPNPETGQIGLEPLHAIYRKSCLPAIERCLTLDQRRVVSFLGRVHLRVVSPDEIRPHDPLFRSFANVNTPQEWLDAQRVG
jgi:molybdopterin-guanine dinucleotide biosynthesis protein A